ncbi:hypothetical protein FOL47_008840, partial [Perkinsus chesapeaki]
MLFTAIVAFFSIVVVNATYFCEDYCLQTEGCGSSYCKENNSCFGLYHKNNDTTCFQPGNSTADCDDEVLAPVMCGEVPPPTTTPIPAWDCMKICDSLESCLESRSGSYCKTWTNPPVCYGILIQENSSLCYDNDDGSCEGEPYVCGDVVTTEGPVEGTTQGPTDGPIDGTIEAPTEGTTEAPTEGTTEAPTEGTTEAPTEWPEEGTTEAPTEGTTEAPTEWPEEGTTEAPTEGTTEAPTEGTTEAPTEGTTEAPTEWPAEGTTEAPTE